MKPNRRGVATLVALSMLALVASALMMATSVFSAEAQRTRNGKADAQARQLLLAGTRAAQARLADDPPANPQTFDVSLPQAVRDLPSTLQMRLNPQADGSVAVELDAQVSGRAHRQSIRLSRQAQVWVITESRLDP